MKRLLAELEGRHDFRSVRLAAWASGLVMAVRGADRSPRPLHDAACASDQLEGLGFLVQASAQGFLRVRHRDITVARASFKRASECWGRRS